MGFGGFMSNITFGWVAKGLGFNASFLGLSAIGVAGGIFSQLRMPETHEPGGAQDKDESDGSAAA
jgi:hypothetical protein